MKIVQLILILLASVAFCTPLQAEKRPNIIFLEVDDLMPRFMNKLGRGFGITPNLDRLASEGIYFPNAVCQGPQCGPSRNSLVTASYPHNLGFYVNKQLPHLPKDVWTFPKELKKAGYRTSYIGKSHLKPYFDRKKVKKEKISKSQIHKEFFGFDFVNCTGERGKMAGYAKTGKSLEEFPFIQHLKSQGKVQQFIDDQEKGICSMEDDFNYLDGYITKEVMEDFSRAKELDQPFFTWINYCLPHGPYDVPERYFEQARKVDIPGPLTTSFGHDVPEPLLRHNSPIRDEASVAKARLGEVANVLFLDTMIGHILEDLENKGLLHNTVIFFFSDHSIFLGNHGRIHKQSLYEEALNPSLIAHFPKTFQKDIISSQPLELLDLIPTAFDLAGIENPEAVSPNGVSFLPVLTGKGSIDRNYAFSEIEGGFGVTSATHRFMNVGEINLLYDRVNDPIEMVNIASEHPEIVETFLNELEAWKNATGPFVKPAKVVEGKNHKDKKKKGKKNKKEKKKKA
jgi:iduronate 2-sulfatase